jgi:phosphoglucomutase
MAIALAHAKDIPLVIANDPDADRFCAAERLSDKSWHIFSGNEIGIILAHYVFQQYKSAKFELSTSTLALSNKAKLAMLSSAVSSKMLRSMAEKEGFHHEETLTGFKWMGNKSLDLIEQGYTAPYAFEEAIGYMFGDIVRDKDGIAAATVFLRLVIELYSQHQTVSEYLESLYNRYFLSVLCLFRYGYFASQNSYVRCEDPNLMTTMFYNLRHHENKDLSYIPSIDGYKITRIKDVSLGYDSKVDIKLALDKSISPSSEMITFDLDDGTVMTLRGSGTEPKLKYYIESVGSSMEEACSKAHSVETALKRTFQKLEVKG